VHLDYKLKNGEIVELLTSSPKKSPSRDWLSQEKDEKGNTHNLFVQTHSARSKIRAELNKQNH
jgi:(p)ppGpp synthase/HD superfamily hydrolase